jgi:hypothetical protein
VEERQLGRNRASTHLRNHEAGDTVDNIDAVGYEQMADAGAYVTGIYASRTLNAGGGAAAAKARSARGVTALRRQAERSE